MASYNRSEFIGNLVADPERRQAGDKDVVGFRIAVNDRFRKDAEALFVSVTVWGKGGDAVYNNLRKADPVFVEGRLSVRSYERRDGGTAFSVELAASDVVFLSGGKKGRDDDRGDSRGGRGRDDGGRDARRNEDRGDRGRDRDRGGGRGRGREEVDPDIPF